MHRRSKTRLQARVSAVDPAGGRLEGADPMADRFDDHGVWRAPPAPWRIEPEPLASSAEARDVLVAASPRLPAEQRAVIELRDMEGRGAADVCTMFDLSDARQRVLLHRGRVTLRAALAATLEPRAS